MIVRRGCSPARDSSTSTASWPTIGQPEYYDVFLRMTVNLGVKHRLVFADFIFDDDILFTEDDPKIASVRRAKRMLIRHGSARERVDGPAVELDAAATRRASDRGATKMSPILAEIVGTVDDRRTLDAAAIQQRWQYIVSERQIARFGFEFEQREAEYHYVSAAESARLAGNARGRSIVVA